MFKYIIGLAAAIFILSGAAWVQAGGDISAVIKQIDLEYDAGYMDDATRQDLVMTLERARSSKFATDDTQYNEIIEAFRVMLAAYTDTRIVPEAAARIYAEAAPL